MSYFNTENIMEDINSENYWILWEMKNFRTGNGLYVEPHRFFLNVIMPGNGRGGWKGRG